MSLGVWIGSEEEEIPFLRCSPDSTVENIFKKFLVVFARHHLVKVRPFVIRNREQHISSTNRAGENCICYQYVSSRRS